MLFIRVRSPQSSKARTNKSSTDRRDAHHPADRMGHLQSTERPFPAALQEFSVRASGVRSRYLNCFAPLPHSIEEAFPTGIVALFSVTQPEVSRLRAQGPCAHAAATLLRDVTMPKTGFQFNWRSVLVASRYCHIWLVSLFRRQLRLERSV